MYEMLTKKENHKKHEINSKQQVETGKSKSVFPAAGWSNANVPKGYKSLFPNDIVQRKLSGDPKNARELIAAQVTLQGKSKDDIAKDVIKDNPDDMGAYTTVGFEHEFAQFLEDQDNPLAGKEHVELVKTAIPLSYTGLPFILETDSLDTIELVGAPLIIPTSKEYPVPFADDINAADHYIQSALKDICKVNTFGEMKNAFSTNMGLAFVNGNTDDINGLKIKFGTKGGGIQPQANFAASALVYDAAKDVSVDKSQGSATGVYLREEKRYEDKMMTLAGSDMTPNLVIFLKELAKNLSFSKFKHYLDIYKKMESCEINRNPAKGLSFMDLGRLISLVKDTNTFWLKDTIFNFGMGILNPQEWQIVYDICLKMKEDTDFTDCKRQINILLQKISILKTNKYKYPFEEPRVQYGEHKPKFLGARQDTYVSLDGKEKASVFKDTTLHLVEVRGLGKDNEAGTMFHLLEKRLLEKSSLQFKNTPLGYDIDINYVMADNTVVVNCTPQNPSLSKKSKIFSALELSSAKIEYVDLGEDDGEMITIPTGSSSYYSITVNNDQTSQFQYFMKRVVTVNHYKS